MKINETFLVGTLFDCNTIPSDHESFFHSIMWRQTVIGCNILQLLQDIYQFKTRYVIQTEENNNLTAEIQTYNYNSKSMDIYVRPMSLRTDVLDLAYPVQAVFDWNFGFIFSKPETPSLQNFYSKPFVRPLWNCLYFMAALCCLLFYYLKRWELKFIPKRNSWECSISYEMLMVIGAYCQHIPPIDAVLYARRTAYLTFFFFAYIVYSYYTSNLLSHLVNDKDDDMSLETLLDSDYECFILDNGSGIIMNTIIASYMNNTGIYDKLISLKSIPLIEGLEAVKSSKSALLSDYVALTPILQAVFTNHEICTLQRIDVFTNINKYFFVSKTFPYREEFKIVLLRIKESGVLSKLISVDFTTAECHVTPIVQAQFSQVLSPLILLFSVHVLSVVILLCEMLHFKRNNPQLPFIH